MCLDKISNWLGAMGIPSSSMTFQKPTLLQVSFKTVNNVRYKVYFRQQGDAIHFESFVFKSVSGETEKINAFLFTLLASNTTLGGDISFSVSEVPGGQWRIMLLGKSRCDDLDVEALYDVLNLIDMVYEDLVPKLKDMADELNLKFDGSMPKTFKSLIKAIFEDD